MMEPENSEESLQRREGVVSNRRKRYERMVEIRLLEDKVIEIFAEGLIPGTTHTCQGQEAVCVGVAAATRPTDIPAAGSVVAAMMAFVLRCVGRCGALDCDTCRLKSV